MAIEASLSYLKFLLLNRVRSPDLFGRTTPVWSFVGRPGDSPELEQRNGTAHRVEGAAPTSSGPEKAAVMSLRASAPILWTEAQVGTPAQQADWARILEEGADTWPYVVAFDNCGFAYCAGCGRRRMANPSM